MSLHNRYRLQYISQGNTPERQLTNIKKALDAGCDWIQLRYKNPGDPAVHALALQTKKHCEAYQAVLIINDFPELAVAVAADGVHLGLDDRPVVAARKLLPRPQIIGGTAHTFEEIRQRASEGCDYVGLGPYRFTTTKKNLRPPLGLENYQRLLHRLRENAIPIPVFAIGGILLSDIPGLMAAGCEGIALSGLLSTNPNPRETVITIRKLIETNIPQPIES